MLLRVVLLALRVIARARDVVVVEVVLLHEGLPTMQTPRARNLRRVSTYRECCDPYLLPFDSAG